MIDAGALHIVRSLRKQGHQALLAGGCVRDWLLGREPRDWDVATDAAPEAVRALFEHTAAVGAAFGIVVVVLEGRSYEVARFRRDGPYGDGRRPERVDFAGPREDARRRDFTINGLFCDPLSGEVIDYVGGRKDLERRVVRTIGAPRERFAEDYLRLVRAVRFAARLGFEIEARTFAAMRARAARVGRVSAERLRDEFTLILTEGGASRGMQLLLESGLLAVVLPEVAALEGVPQPPQFHPEGDVWTHVRGMLQAMENPTPALAWGVLLHDVGKPPTLTRTDRIRFEGHDAVGARMAEEICRRLRMANDERARIVQMTAQHMRFRHLKQMRPGKLKRFLRQPHFGEMLELHRLDCLGSHGKLDLYDFCRRVLAAQEPETLRPPRLLSGRDLVSLGLEPGPLFKEILAAVEEAQLEGEVKSREEALALVRRRFAGHLS